ncbi:MAG TPA: uroporphyrinogen-III C-methyltransferase [Candidatus Acidoferrum sp.]|nr:uroporphyrinogen-III C-methyltransferase [Candidatus Acidoferrum sp.]
MSLFPAFLKLANRRVLVVGGGGIAAQKIPGLLEAGAQVHVVSPKLSPQLTEWVRNQQITWSPKPFEADDLNSVFLVIAATSLRDLNAHVYREADQRNILCNAVDDIAHCHFYYGSIVQRGDLQIAISTNGKSPALAQRLRKELEQQFGPEYQHWLDWLGAARETLRAQSADPESTKRELHSLASKPMFKRFLHVGAALGRLPKNVVADLQVGHSGASLPEANDFVAAAFRGGRLFPSSKNHQSRVTSHHKVFLLGAGPGDPELLTLKALRILQSADVVFHDSLIGPEILNLIPKTAERIDVGKRAGFRLLTQQDINSLLLSNAAKHKIVVRLKGGDPLLFGRAAEEIQALREANIDFEVVPGISAAFGAASAAKVSLTDRRLSSHVLFTTFSRAPESKFLPGVGLTADTTVVVYMPGPDYAEVSRWLQDAAVSADTRVLVISKASRPDQSEQATTVSGLAHLAPLPAPALLLVGRVAASSEARTAFANAASPQNFLHNPIEGATLNARIS